MKSHVHIKVILWCVAFPTPDIKRTFLKIKHLFLTYHVNFSWHSLKITPGNNLRHLNFIYNHEIFMVHHNGELQLCFLRRVAQKDYNNVEKYFFTEGIANVVLFNSGNPRSKNEMDSICYEQLRMIIKLGQLLLYDWLLISCYFFRSHGRAQNHTGSTPQMTRPGQPDTVHPAPPKPQQSGEWSPWQPVALGLKYNICVSCNLDHDIDPYSFCGVRRVAFKLLISIQAK